LKDLIWAQEEPKNNGAWFFVEDLLEQCLADAGLKGMRGQYAGRDSSASPATGLAKRHAAEQAALIAAALGHPPATPGSTKPAANRTERAGGPAVAAR
jgi:2-oxoglutarate dehydrogenase E1 component